MYSIWWYYGASTLLLSVRCCCCNNMEKSYEYIDDLPDPTDPFDKRPIPTPELSSAKTDDKSVDISLDRSNNIAVDPFSLPLDIADSSVEDGKIISSGLNTADVVFMRRLVSSILDHINEASITDEYMASLTIPTESLAVLTSFAESNQNDVQEASEVLVSSFNCITPAQPVPPILSSWLSEHKNTIAAVLQVLMIIMLTLALLWSTVRMWQGLRWRQFIFFVLTTCFIVSVPWTWIHLYKQKLAERMQRSDIHYKAPPECDPRMLSVTNLLWWSSTSSICDKYYQDQIVDPLWEVKPTTALAYTFVEFFWKPLEIMGEPLGTFVRELLEPLPFYLKPVVTILGLLFLWWCLVLLSGMRVWTWFFTIEPAVTAQHQLTAIQSSVDEMRQFIRDTTDANAQREVQVSHVLDRLTLHATRQDEMDEIIPVLHDMCADYGQRQNNPQARKNHADADKQSVKMRDHPLVKVSDETDSQSVHYSHPTAAGDATIVSLSEKDEDKFTLNSADHLVMTTGSIDVIRQFYCSIGMTARTFGDERVALHFGLSKINLHKAGEEVEPHAKYPTAGSIDLCLVCDCQLDTTVSHLKHNNIDIELGPVTRTGAQGPITSIYIRDPDGNLIELAHYVQSAGVDNSLVETNTSSA